MIDLDELERLAAARYSAAVCDAVPVLIARVRELESALAAEREERARWHRRVATALRAYHGIEPDRRGRCRGCGGPGDVPCGVGCPLRALLDALATDAIRARGTVGT